MIATRHVPTPEVLGRIIADSRKSQGLTQEQLGEQMGVRQATVSKIERSPRDSRLDTLFRALAALNLELKI